MKAKHIWIAVLLSTGLSSAPNFGAAMPLSVLTAPTLKTEINLGSVPISIGEAVFTNLAPGHTGPGNGLTADRVQSDPFVDSGSAPQLISNWFAVGGTRVDKVLTFDVRAFDPARPIAQYNLLSNGAALNSTASSYALTTRINQFAGRQSATAMLITFDHGVTSRVEPTRSDINYNRAVPDPHKPPVLSDAVFESSSAQSNRTSAGAGALANESIVPTALVDVPEPGCVGCSVAPGIVLLSARARGRKRRVANVPIP